MSVSETFTIYPDPFPSNSYVVHVPERLVDDVKRACHESAPSIYKVDVFAIGHVRCSASSAITQIGATAKPISRRTGPPPAHRKEKHVWGRRTGTRNEGGRRTARAFVGCPYRPGLASAATDNSPSGVVMYSLAGAPFGDDMFPDVRAVLSVDGSVPACRSEIAAQTGKGLTVNMREHHSPLLAYFAVMDFLIAEIITTAGGVIATGAAARLL